MFLLLILPHFTCVLGPQECECGRVRKGECAAAVKVKSIFASIYSTMRLTEEMRKPSQFTGSRVIFILLSPHG